MQVLKATVIMAFACLVPVITASLSSSVEYVANSKLISTLHDNFTLVVLITNEKDELNLEKSDPLLISTFVFSKVPLLIDPNSCDDGICDPRAIDRGFDYIQATIPVTGLANIHPTTFSLKNKKLSTGGFDFELLSDNVKINPDFDSFVFASDLPTVPINFTAVGTSDSYGRKFLRLGADDGKFVPGDYVVKLNQFSAIIFHNQEGGRVFGY